MKVAIILHVLASVSWAGFYAIKSQSELLVIYSLEIHIYEPHSTHHLYLGKNIIYLDYISHF